MSFPLSIRTFDEKLQTELDALEFPTLIVHASDVSTPPTLRVAKKEKSQEITPEDAGKVAVFMKEHDLHTVQLQCHEWQRLSKNELNTVMMALKNVEDLSVTINGGLQLSLNEKKEAFKQTFSAIDQATGNPDGSTAGYLKSDLAWFTNDPSYYDLSTDAMLEKQLTQKAADPYIMSIHFQGALTKHMNREAIRAIFQEHWDTPVNNLQPIDLSDLGGMPNLKKLSIINANIQPVTVQSLAAFSAIEDLQLGQPDHARSGGVQDEDLVHLQGMKRLAHLSFLDNPAFTGEGLHYLAGLPITNIHLFENNITANGMGTIAEHFPDIERVQVACNRKADNGSRIEDFAGLKKLKALSTDYLQDTAPDKAPRDKIIEEKAKGKWTALESLGGEKVAPAIQSQPADESNWTDSLGDRTGRKKG